MEVEKPESKEMNNDSRFLVGQLRELLNCHDIRTTRVNILHKRVMSLSFRVVATIREDNNTVIEIEAFTDRGEDNAASRDTSEDNGINIVGSEDATKGSVGEHAKASFGENGVVLLDVKLGMQLGSVRSDNQAIVGLDTREHLSRKSTARVRKVESCRLESKLNSQTMLNHGWPNGIL